MKLVFKYLVIFRLIFIFSITFGQSSDALELIRVTYHAPVNNTHWVRIKTDGIAGTEISDPNKTIAWELNSAGVAEQKPVAYVSGAVPKVSACFRKEGTNAVCEGSGNRKNAPNLYVRGWIVDNNNQPLGMDAELPPQQLVKLGRKTYEYVSQNLSFPLALNQVQYIPEFRIRWEWSTSSSGSWKEAGISSNRLYSTFQQPNNLGPHFYTCVHLACSEANDASSVENIISSVQTKFGTKCITRVDDVEGNCLKFWGDPVNTNQNRGLEYLLENAQGTLYEDGRCGDWVELYESIMAVHGIKGAGVTALAYVPAGSSTGVFNSYTVNGNQDLAQYFLGNTELFFGNELFPTPNDPVLPTNVLIDNAKPNSVLPGSGVRIVLHGVITTNLSTGGQQLVIISQFFVKDWEFNNGGNQFYAILPVGTQLDIVDPQGVLVQTLNGADASGVSAQGGVSNPESHFDDHVLFKYLGSENGSYENRLYDPSYGPDNEFPDKNTWVTESLSGYGTLITYFTPGSFRRQLVWLHETTNISNTNIITIK